MSERTIPLTLPESVWGKLASVADNRGVKVADLLADTVQALVANPGRQLRAQAIVLPFVDGKLAELNAELSAARRDGFRVSRRDGFVMGTTTKRSKE